MKLFLMALQFLTRIPVQIKSSVSNIDLARSMALYPLVGLLIGGSAAGLYVLLSAAFSPLVCDLLAVLFLIIITGNMHLDGLMDAADGLFSGRPREKMLEIMKDSRVGAHGVIAGCAVVLLKFVLISQLPQEMKLPALIVMPVAGRWSQVYGAKFYPYARVGTGTGSFTDHVGWQEMFWATLVFLPVTILALELTGLYLFGSVLAGSALMGRYVFKKLGGVTGDTLGAVTECVEVLVLFMLQLL